MFMVPPASGATRGPSGPHRRAAEVFRLGARALFSDVLGDWRTDPAVRAFCMRRGEAWASGRIPAILDGEPVKLARRVEIEFTPLAFRALAAKPKEAVASRTDGRRKAA